MSALNPFFLSDAWTSAWLETLGADARPIRTGGVTLAARRREGFNVVRLAAGEHSDYEELPDPEALDVGAALDGSDALILGHVPAGSATLEWAARTGARSARFGVSLGTPLAGSWQEQRRALRKKLVQDTTRCGRRLGEELGEWRLERVRDPWTATDTLEFISEQHRARATAVGRTSMFDDPATARFYGLVVDRALGDDRLHLSRLVVGDRVVAAHLGFDLGERFQYYLPTFDPELSRFSPGRLLLFGLVQEAIERGVRFLDLGRGELDYKLELNPQPTELFTVLVPAPTARGRLAADWFARVRPRLAERFRSAAPALRRAGLLREYS